MKICFIGSSSSIHMRRWMEYFKNCGHEISFISFDPVKIEGVNVYSLNAHYFSVLPLFLRRILKWRYILKIKSLIRKIKPDILHGHYVSDYGFFAAATKFHLLVLTAWGSDILIDPYNSKIVRWQVKKSLRQASLITTESKYVKKGCIFWGADPEIIEIIQWGVDLKQTKDIACAVPQGVKINPNFPIVISPRGFRDIFKIDIIIQSIPMVLLKYPNTQFIFLGDLGCAGLYQKLVQKLNIEKNIQFISWLKHEELIALFKKSTILISIPTSDSTSIALLEGMACGNIPIVSDLPSNQEWIYHEENGFIVSPVNSKILAENITKALKITPQKREIIQTKNYKIIKERASFEKNMARMEQLYFKLISKK